jgi:hypothetical protein
MKHLTTRSRPPVFASLSFLRPQINFLFCVCLDRFSRRNLTPIRFSLCWTEKDAKLTLFYSVRCYFTKANLILYQLRIMSFTSNLQNSLPLLTPPPSSPLLWQSVQYFIRPVMSSIPRLVKGTLNARPYSHLIHVHAFDSHISIFPRNNLWSEENAFGPKNFPREVFLHPNQLHPLYHPTPTPLLFCRTAHACPLGAP